MNSLKERAFLVDGVVVIECDTHLTSKQRDDISAYAKKAWPERRVAVFDRGVRLSRVSGDEESGFELSPWGQVCLVSVAVALIAVVLAIFAAVKLVVMA